MPILLVCKTLPHTYKGGIQTHTWQLSQQLLHAGHQVSILTSGSYKNGTQLRNLQGRTLIELAYLPLRKSPMASAFLDEWAFNKAAEEWMILHQQNFDLIHLQGRSGCLALRKKDQIRIPVVATLHGFKSNEYAAEGRQNGLNIGIKMHQAFAQKLEQLALTKADKVIAVSPFLANDAAEKCIGKPAPLEIIPNGINIQSHPKKVDFSKKKLLFVGRLDKLKGVYELLEAVTTCSTELELVIVGDGAERNGIEARAKQLGITSKVHFRGALPQAAVQAEIDACYALILPSFLETQGIVLMEANARCKPVLASNIPGIRSVVTDGQNGLLFEVGNTKDMAAKIDFLFANPTLAESLGKNGRQQMETHFSWEKIAEQTISLYQIHLQPEQTAPAAQIA